MNRRNLVIGAIAVAVIASIVFFRNDIGKFFSDLLNSGGSDNTSALEREADAAGKKKREVGVEYWGDASETALNDMSADDLIELRDSLAEVLLDVHTKGVIMGEEGMKAEMLYKIIIAELKSRNALQEARLGDADEYVRLARRYEKKSELKSNEWENYFKGQNTKMFEKVLDMSDGSADIPDYKEGKDPKGAGKTKLKKLTHKTEETTTTTDKGTGASDNPLRFFTRIDGIANNDNPGF